MREIDLYKLAELFLEHDYFNDEKEVTTEYEILLEVYSILSTNAREQLKFMYKALDKKRNKRQA